VKGITVSGRGEASAVPDTLSIDLGVAVIAPTVGAAFAGAAERAGAVIGALRSAGVAESDVQTRDLSVHPEYDHRSDTPRLLGYRVTHAVTARLRNPAATGDVVGAAAEAGGDDFVMNGLSFAVDDDTALLELARAAAWQDARSKAEQLAALAGVTLGGPHRITESSGGGIGPMPRVAKFAAESMPVAVGTTAVSVELTVTFAIASTG
jgi:uncharacterized protein YggE